MFKIVNLFYKLIDFIKNNYAREEQFVEKAKKILESAKKIEGFLGGGYSDEKIIAKITKELRENRIVSVIYAIVALFLLFPIYTIFIHGVFNCFATSVVVYFLQYAFYSIFTFMGILTTLRVK